MLHLTMAATEQKKTNFIVGQELSLEELSQFDWADLQKRSLNDPRYASCNAAFNWRDYIQLTFTDKTTEQQTIKTLDQFATTPEGQQTIRQAHAMHLYRIKTGQTQILPQFRDQPPKIHITDQINAQSIFSVELGAIAINVEEVAQVSTRSSDGKYYHGTLAKTIYHELCHVKDPFIDANKKRYHHSVKATELNASIAAIKKTLGANDNIQEDDRFKQLIEKAKSVVEYPAMAETNAFMQKYYGEKSDALDHSDMRINFFFNEWIGRTNPQPNLPKGIAYNDMPSPPKPSCKAAPAR